MNTLHLINVALDTFLACLPLGFATYAALEMFDATIRGR
jgi:hypothetical protein